MSHDRVKLLLKARTSLERFRYLNKLTELIAVKHFTIIYKERSCLL